MANEQDETGNPQEFNPNQAETVGYAPNQPLGVDNPSPQPPATKNKPPLIPIAIGVVLVLLLGLAAAKMADKSKDTTTNKTPDTNQQQPKAAIQSAGTISINANGFTPATIKIKQGQSITWTNTDDKPHQPATDPYPAQNGLAGFKSEEPLNKNETFSFTFDKPGTYTYHDNLNPLKLKGTVVVE